MFDERVEFGDPVLVEQVLDALSGGELPLFGLFLAATSPGGGAALTEVVEAVEGLLGSTALLLLRIHHSIPPLTPSIWPVM
ncbi:hypothetical protein ACKVMT_11680 [Halobacteriales archaeon Cl-PHB]